MRLAVTVQPHVFSPRDAFVAVARNLRASAQLYWYWVAPIAHLAGALPGRGPIRPLGLARGRSGGVERTGQGPARSCGRGFVIW